MSTSIAVDRARSPRALVDLLAVAVLIGCAVVGFGPSFAGSAYLRAAGVGALAGLGLAWLGARLRWSVLSVAAAGLVTYLLLGGAAALPPTAVAGVFPTLTTVRELARGAVTAWKDLLTLTPPLDAFPQLLVVPFLACLVVALLAGSIALRARRSAWALLPLGLLLAGVIALGTQESVAPLVQGVVFALVSLVWTAWRRAEARADHRQAVLGDRRATPSRPLRARRIRNAAILVSGVAVVTAVAAPALAPATYRHVLRDVVQPPLDLRQYASPLVGYRKYVKDLKDDVLFTVTGLPEGARLRLATLDAYTGTVIDVAGGDPSAGTASGSFGRAGAELPLPGAVAPHGEAADVEVTVGAYRGVWLPTVGTPLSVTFDGARAEALTSSLYYNPDTRSALTTTPLQAGDTYAMAVGIDAVVPDDASGASVAQLPLPTPAKVPDSVASTAERLVGGASDPWEQLTKLHEALATSGVFSDGLEGQPASRAGHGSDRIETLLAGRAMVGDDEQFAVAMTLMARAVGIPARVVMGFYPGPDAATAEDGGVELTGTDVHAWVEVPVQSPTGFRWVTFDPTPDETQQPQEQDPRSNSKPEPQALQEPPPPDAPAEPPQQPIPDAAQDDRTEESARPWGQYLGVAAAIGVPLLALLSPFVLIAVAKARRRRGRRVAGRPVDRLSGGWREVVDTAVDLGDVVPASATRRETARVLAARYPAASPHHVADVADAAVFGPGEPTVADIEAFWSEVDRLVGDITGSVGRWRRMRARFSIRSLRQARTNSRGGRR